MTARILDGIKIRDEIFAELKTEVAQLAAQGVRPGLAAVLVGENPASQMYVKSKVAACEQLGMASWLHTPAASSTTEYLLQLVDDLNRDDNVDGILVQLPLALAGGFEARAGGGFSREGCGRISSGEYGHAGQQ